MGGHHKIGFIFSLSKFKITIFVLRGMSRQDATSTGNTVMSHHLMITLAYIQRPLAPALTADTSFKRMRESSLSNNGTFSSKYTRWVSFKFPHTKSMRKSLRFVREPPSTRKSPFCPVKDFDEKCLTTSLYFRPLWVLLLL
jgi:hypothetical protein